MNKPLTKEEMQSEALSRATTGQSFANYPAILEGFAAKGIAAHDIEPRVNVFTYNAWLAKGRQVRKGEKGVKIVTFISVDDKDDDTRSHKMAKTTTVFHISQTDPATPRKSVHSGWTRQDDLDRGDYVRDPGEDAADAWSASHSADR